MNEKIVGYIMLGTGILLIFYALFSIFRIFTGKSVGYNLFDLEGISLDLSSMVGSDLSPAERAALANQGGMPQLKTEIIDSDLINKPLNLLSNLMLMGFVASIGQKLASIGAMLVRPINVKLREEGGASKTKIASN
jgi:hypothetical protein